MKLFSHSFIDNAPVPPQCAFCVIDPAKHVALSGNRNPHLAWSEAPGLTRSFALICHDQDVPSRGDDVNQEGRIVPPELPRIDFYHWVLIDIPGNVRDLAEGSHSDGVTPHGKSGPNAPEGMRHGINDYTGWFAGDQDMGGDYYGYDGPCPPWNDSVMHHYQFTLYALDLEHLPLTGAFTGPDVLKAIEGHVLAQADITGTYTLNPALI
jgi:Raf kinase inhibitor-like YbhB/YbcL family protein